MIYALKCVQPGFTLFEKKFWSELLNLVNAFKAACLFHPAKVTDLQPDATMEELKCFYLEQGVLDLKRELPTYLAADEGVSEC